LGDPLVYLRAVHFAATILAAGAVIFQLVVAAPAFAAVGAELYSSQLRQQRRWAWIVCAALAIAVLSGALWLIELAGNIYNAYFDYLWDNGALWSVATETRFGRISALRLVTAVLLAFLLLRPAAKPTARLAQHMAQLVLAIVLLVSPAWVGHAGAVPGDAGEFSLAADALHLLAAGVWLGGLPPLAMLLAGAWGKKERGWAVLTATAVRRFSVLGVGSVGLLLASGIVNSWYELGGVGDLVATPYGRLVLAKVALFAAMVTFAAINRLHLTPRLAIPEAVRQLQRNSLAEIALGVAVIVIVGFLGAMAPASHAHHHPAYAPLPADAAFVHIHSTSGMADLTLEPGRVGATRATIRLWDDQFEPLAAQRVTLSLSAPGKSGRDVNATATEDDEGNWQVDGIKLTRPGEWTAAVDATLDAKRSLVLEAPIVIEPER
jgi:putative copper resistance protein D